MIIPPIGFGTWPITWPSVALPTTLQYDKFGFIQAAIRRLSR
jgi:hypothetical protein